METCKTSKIGIKKIGLFQTTFPLKQKSILFITTTNLASNPRLFKELNLSLELFHEIDVVQFSVGGWSDEITEKLKKDFHKVNFVELSAKRKPFLNWFLTSVQQLLLKQINYKWLNVKLLSFSLTKRTIILTRYLRKKNNQYDWVVAHNPGAFFPAFEYSNRNNCNLGLDIEDYHPGEYTNALLSQRMLEMMKIILPKADYCSFAAPLIQLEVEKHIPNQSSNWFTVINGFSQSEFIRPNRINSTKIKMIWFSQNIAPGRGLENFISLIEEFSENFELHLVGALSDANRKLMFKQDSKVKIYPPMAQSDLHRFLSDFHVGLALEPAKDLNNSIALSNKLIAYAQSGLFILATPTPGQISFLNNYGFRNVVVKNEESEIKKCMFWLKGQFDSNEIQESYNFGLAKNICWESINGRLLVEWESEKS